MLPHACGDRLELLALITLMPPLALKPDSGFFRKIALGAVGSRHVAQDLDYLGHQIAELERVAMALPPDDERLIDEFEEPRAGTTPSTVGSAAEQPVRDQLEQVLPKRVGVGESFVIDSYDRTSRQQDVILYERDIVQTPEADT